MAGTSRRGDALGAGLMALASLQFGVVVVVGKVSTRTGLPIPTTLAVRYALAAAILIVALAVARQPLAAAPGERLGLIVLGVAGYAVESGFFFAALDHGAASAVTLLFFTYPVFVALGSMAMGRGAPGWLLGGALVSSVSGAGLVVASTGGLSIEPIGVLFALTSALTFAGYLLGADIVLKKTRSLTSSMWVSAAAAAGFVVFALLAGEAAIPRGMDQWGPPSAMGLGTAGAFVCLLTGLRLLGPVRTAVIASTEPVAGSTLAFVFLDEPIRAGMIAGGILILAGAVAASLARPPPPAETSVP